MPRADPSVAAREAVRMAIAIARDADRDTFTLSDFKRRSWPGIATKPSVRVELLEHLLATGRIQKSQERTKTAAEATYFPKLETGASFESVVSSAFRETRACDGVTLKESLDVTRFVQWFYASGRGSNAAIMARALSSNVPPKSRGREKQDPPGEGDELAERAERITAAETSYHCTDDYSRSCPRGP